MRTVTTRVRVLLQRRDARTLAVRQETQVDEEVRTADENTGLLQPDDLQAEEDLEVAILVCSLVLTFIHTVRLVLTPVITQRVYSMTPLVISLETGFEALMVTLNFVLMIGIWHRHRIMQQMWLSGTLMVLLANIIWRFYRVTFGEAWEIVVCVMDVLMLGAYAVVWNNTYDLVNGIRSRRGYVVAVVDRLLSVQTD